MCKRVSKSLLALLALLLAVPGCPASTPAGADADRTLAELGGSSDLGLADDLNVPPDAEVQNQEAGAAEAAVQDVQGADTAPVCPGALPLTCGDRFSHSTEVQGRPDLWWGYSCSARLESGPEAVYAFSTGEACQNVVRLGGMEADLDLFLLASCDPFSCQEASPVPVDIQDLEAVTFRTEAGHEDFVVVDGYSDAAGAYELQTDCLCGATPVDFADGSWLLQVDRRWDGHSGGIQFPTDQFEEQDYQPVADEPPEPVVISGAWTRASIGGIPISGVLSPETPGRLKYDLSSGTFAGGRFVVWVADGSLQAELTIYGSGLPIVSSERGSLVPKPVQ